MPALTAIAPRHAARLAHAALTTLALATALTATTALATTPAAHAAKIICVWDDNQKKWVCSEETAAVGSLAPIPAR